MRVKFSPPAVTLIVALYDMIGHCRRSRTASTSVLEIQSKRSLPAVLYNAFVALETAAPPDTTSFIIAVNGASRSVAGGTTIEALILDLDLDLDAVAIERNRDIVRRYDWRATVLAEGDTIEIVHFVGGG